jgi:hypothetical protein
MKMLIAGDTVFRLRNRFNDMASEVRKILMVQPGCTIAIDDCYSLREDLDRIVGEVNSTGAKLLLTSRTLAHDSAPDIRRNMLEDTPYRTFDIDILNTHEIDDLIDCTDRIGGWGSTVQSRSQKRKIIEREKNSRLAGFILGVFQADHIRQRFKSELDYFKRNGLSAEKLLIIAMYLKSIGTSVQESVLSELLQLDALSVLNRTGGPNSHQHEFISFDSKSKAFELIASINARDALKNLFDEKTVTSAIIEAIQNMEKVRHEPAFKHIFSQFMRYTQLQLVVNNREEQDRFFDRLSEIYFCKNHVLFWLQWSMAMRDHGKYTRAYQYLEEAYGRAHERDFDTDHLDDQKAGLLLDSIKENAGSADFLRSFRESATLLNKMISKGADTPHNYQTITSFDLFFEKWGRNFDAAHGPIVLQTLNVLKSSVEKQITKQQPGFAKTCMEAAVETIVRSADMVSRTQKGFAQ